MASNNIEAMYALAEASVGFQPWSIFVTEDGITRLWSDAAGSEWVFASKDEAEGKIDDLKIANAEAREVTVTNTHS